MINTFVVSSFGQTVLESSKLKVSKIQVKDPEEDQIIEGFEGDCEQCENQKPQKACSICEE